jgi:hypothetical protein
MNLADGILLYDEESSRWTDTVPQFFETLAELRARLEEVGFVGSQLNLRARRSLPSQV